MHNTNQKTQIEHITEKVIVGKDVLELVSSAMYLDPLTIFREYVQNAADAIDEAEELGLYQAGTKPRINIWISPHEKNARIRDNGTGIRKSRFVRLMTALGGSKKRGSTARGFRGIGRLAGLGYCQKLIFRTRHSSENQVTELHWDCRLLKQALQDQANTSSLDDIVQSIVTLHSRPDAVDYPAHFFEVELQGVVRYKNDLLLNKEAISTYLSQVGPVPFSPDFLYGKRISAYLDEWKVGSTYQIYLDDATSPIYRPFTDEFASRTGIEDKFLELETIMFNGINDEIAAIGWILHHGYYGALSEKLGFKGLRMRKGNMQVGSDSILDDVFPESRFNAWCVGEIHAISKNLIPNGRRDNFDHNKAYLHIESQLRPWGFKLAKKCRIESHTRNVAKMEMQLTFMPSDEIKPPTTESSPQGKPMITKEQEKILKQFPTSRMKAFQEVVSALYELHGLSAKDVVDSIFQFLGKS